MVKLVVMIPAYNEEKTIAGVIREIPRSIKGIDSVEVVVIDDGSSDNTVRTAVNAGTDEIITHKVNKGLGVTFRDGLALAVEKGADVIVNIDADGQYNATEIPALITPILSGKADMVLGWRNIDSLDFMPTGKKLGNKLATWLTRRLSGLPIKDAQTGFRAFSREAALKMNLRGKYTYVQESLIQASYKGLRIEQVPVEFRARNGKSRLIPSLGVYATRAGATIISTYRDHYPLKFFSGIGSTLLLIGLGFGLNGQMNFSQTGMVSSYLLSTFFLASMLLIIGLGTIACGIFAHIANSRRQLNEETVWYAKGTGSTRN